jgi:hypothetical protein
MKTFAIALATLAALTTAASAMSQPGLSSAAQSEVQSMLPGADLTGLTSAQVGAIGAILHGEDSGKAGQIRAILN